MGGRQQSSIESGSIGDRVSVLLCDLDGNPNLTGAHGAWYGSRTSVVPVAGWTWRPVCASTTNTGLVFAAFLPGQGREIARGGRYDDVGKVFGNARPATGFSTDLLNLYQLAGASGQFEAGILVPDNDDAALVDLILQLRDAGERVVVDLSRGKSEAADQQCNRVAVQSNGTWVVKEV